MCFFKLSFLSHGCESVSCHEGKPVLDMCNAEVLRVVLAFVLVPEIFNSCSWPT